jgi:hypothetical protein
MWLLQVPVLSHSSRCFTSTFTFFHSATYFFAFFLLSVYPDRPIAPFGCASVCLVLTYTLPPVASHIISNTKGVISFNARAAAVVATALALLCFGAPLVFPAAISFSNYTVLHFSAQALLRVVNRVRKPKNLESTDHALHFVCATAGVVFACCSRVLPDQPHLAQLAVLLLILAVRINFRGFPL